jgi:hypothetical protein
VGGGEGRRAGRLRGNVWNPLVYFRGESGTSQLGPIAIEPVFELFRFGFIENLNV